MSPDSPIGILTGYGVDDRGVISGWIRDFFIVVTSSDRLLSPAVQWVQRLFLWE